MPPVTMTPSSTANAASAQNLNGVDLEVWKKKNLLQLFNISVGFLGIQFAWAIQMGQMSPLLERLGSNPQLLGLISCAGPVTGVLVQPIVGALSDKCGLPLGRRRPFLLLGALLTAVALILMPNSTEVAHSLSAFGAVEPLMIAALLLWILDASINITQGPYRAIVPDVVHKSQQATAYSLMSLTIGLGSVAAFLIAFIIPSLHNLFYLGAAAMTAAMIWTVVSTPEPKPQPVKPEAGPQDNFLVATVKSIASMPAEGLKLCVAHMFTWFGLACLFTFFSVYVPHHIFGATDTGSKLYQDGVQWASLCYAVLNAVCFVFSALISKLCSATSKKAVHSFGLLCMAAAFISMMFITSPVHVMIAMGFIGIGWATTLSIPFALLSDHLPPGKEGVMMGTFNIFIAAPGVLSNLLVGQIVHAYGDNVAVAMIVGGTAMIVSMLLLQLVTERGKEGGAAPKEAFLAIEEQPAPI
jgi:maltose/moltooligosaccharide transporter